MFWVQWLAMNILDDIGWECFVVFKCILPPSLVLILDDEGCCCCCSWCQCLQTSLCPLRLSLLWYLRIFFIHLFVPWDSSCSDTWGWCLGSSACARRCSDTCPLPPSPGLRNILFRGCEISKVSFVSPAWWQMFVLVVVKNQSLSSSGHSDNTWSWITLLLWMFALISSWTWKHQTWQWLCRIFWPVDQAFVSILMICYDHMICLACPIH